MTPHADMRYINDDLDQAEHKLNDDRAYRDLHDDEQEIVTLGQQTSNDHCTKETAEEVKHNDYKDLVEESLQTSKELVSDSNTGTDIICIKGELAQAEHKIDDDKAYTDLHDDKKEVELSIRQP